MGRDSPSDQQTMNGRCRPLPSISLAAVSAIFFLICVAPIRAKPLPQQSLDESIQRRKQFPFQANCAGSTREIVACLWSRIDAQDIELRRRFKDEASLEQWRQGRRSGCQLVASRVKGGSAWPIYLMSCEEELNRKLLEALKREG
jgi:uncharacterized protein YecT (DUF1311 family)